MQPVRLPEELPPRFDPYWPELSSAALVAKVPFGVERRAALPGSDLYERVLALCPGGLVFLRIDGEAIRRVELPYGSLSWVALTIDLLDAHLLFGGEDEGRLDLAFNAVSEPLAMEIVAAALARLGSDAPGIPRGPDLAAPPTEAEDFFFANFLSRQRSREPELSLLAYQRPCRVPGSPAQGAYSLVRDALFPTWLDSAMLLELPGHLLAVRRGKSARRGPKGFRVERGWIPTPQRRAPRLEELSLPNGGRVSVLDPGAGGGAVTGGMCGELSLLFSEPPAAALGRLEALAGRLGH